VLPDALQVVVVPATAQVRASLVMAGERHPHRLRVRRLIAAGQHDAHLLPVGLVVFTPPKEERQSFMG
jgi:hypothetical protein